MTAPVVIYVNGGASCAHPGTDPGGQPSGPLPAHFPNAQHAEILGRRQVYDPHQVRRDFPNRWQAYIRANFRNLAHICQVFQVCERTARKWWDGETGANGAHVAVAVNEHPREAPAMLFAAE